MQYQEKARTDQIEEDLVKKLKEVNLYSKGIGQKLNQIKSTPPDTQDTGRLMQEIKEKNEIIQTLMTN